MTSRLRFLPPRFGLSGGGAVIVNEELGDAPDFDVGDHFTRDSRICAGEYQCGLEKGDHGEETRESVMSHERGPRFPKSTNDPPS